MSTPTLQERRDALAQEIARIQEQHKDDPPLSRNLRDFTQVPGLRVEDWTA